MAESEEKKGDCLTSTTYKESSTQKLECLIEEEKNTERDDFAHKQKKPRSTKKNEARLRWKQNMKEKEKERKKKRKIDRQERMKKEDELLESLPQGKLN